MTDITKLSFKSGSIEFSGEGREAWLEKQLDKLLAIPAIVANIVDEESPEARGKGSIGKKSLATFLSEKNAKTNQNRKFLATAVFLHEKGAKRIKTGDVAKALKDSNQQRLGNPSDTLKQNVGKGFCEKDGTDFFVTDEGYAEIGL